MTEQIVEGVVSAEVDTESSTIVPKGTLGAETSGASPQKIFVSWSISGRTGQEHLIDGSPKTLTERLSEAYSGDDLEPEEREFLDLTREHFSRLDDE
jgi:hypothetical protein